MSISNTNKLEVTVAHGQREADHGYIVGDLFANIKGYIHSAQFSDLIIQTEAREFKVHKLLICGQSEYFSRLFSRNWMETSENTIQLKEDNPQAVEAMIHFMYGFDYDSSGSDHSRVSPMLFNVNVYQIADKYVVPKLKRHAKEKFEKIIETCWEMDDFPMTITEAYSSTPKTDRGLRDPLIRTALNHIDRLLKTEDFVRVLEETVGFSADLIQRSISQKSTNPSLTKYRCSNCDKQWELESSLSLSCCPLCGYSRSNWKSCIVK